MAFDDPLDQSTGLWQNLQDASHAELSLMWYPSHGARNTHGQDWTRPADRPSSHPSFQGFALLFPSSAIAVSADHYVSTRPYLTEARNSISRMHDTRYPYIRGHWQKVVHMNFADKSGTGRWDRMRVKYDPHASLRVPRHASVHVWKSKWWEEEWEGIYGVYMQFLQSFWVLMSS